MTRFNIEPVYACMSCMRQVPLFEVWQQPTERGLVFTHHTADGHPVVRIEFREQQAQAPPASDPPGLEAAIERTREYIRKAMGFGGVKQAICATAWDRAHRSGLEHALNALNAEVEKATSLAARQSDPPGLTPERRSGFTPCADCQHHDFCRSWCDGVGRCAQTIAGVPRGTVNADSAKKAGNA